MIPDYLYRQFDPTPDEYDAIVRVYTRSNPHESASAATWQHWDQHREPIKQFTRYVVEKQGEIGGYGFTTRTDVEAKKFRFAIHLSPEWATAGLIDQFYSYLMGQCLEYAPNGLVSQTLEDETEKIGWLKQQGFQQAMRYPRSTLDVAGFDPTAFSELKATIADQGLDIISLAELATYDLGWQKKVYDLEMLLNQDVPRPTTFSPPPFDRYAQSEFDDPDFAPDLWLIARDGDEYVGTTSLFNSGDNVEILETGLTGVRHEYRRRGLATALKCQGIEAAKRLGAGLIQTWNEENNPMFQLNLQLGFQAQPADVDWEKQLDGGRQR